MTHPQYTFEIIPGILENDWVEIERKIELVKAFATTIHIDIIDGKFAPNSTFLDPDPFKKYTNDIFFELHMMVENPLQYLEPFAKAGFKRFLGHVEKMPDQTEFVAKGKLFGEVGLALNGDTSLDVITTSYDSIDTVLIMTIQAGFSGQSFIAEHLNKVKTIRNITQGKIHGQNPFPIEVDGGVTNTTVVLAKNAGATRFISTSYLFGNGSPQDTFTSLERIVSE